MDYQKAKEIAEKVIESGVNSITVEQDRFARKIYKELNDGKPFRGCTNCWNDLVILTTLKLKSIQTNQKTIMQKFKLNPSKIIHLHGFDPIGAKNMTDEKALAILKKSSAHIKSFETYPDNWKELVEKFEPSAVKVSPSQPKGKKKDAASGSDDDNAGKKKGDDNGGDDGKDNGSAKEKLELMSKKELKDICEAKEFPKEEYEKLNKEKLVAYVLAKV